MADSWQVLDCEWDPDDNDRLLVVGWGTTAYRAGRIPQRVLAELADPSITKVAFTKADHAKCRENNITVRGEFHDIQTMAWTIDERTELDLASVAQRYGTVQKDERLTRHQGAMWFCCDDGEYVPLGEAPIEQLKAYNEQDLAAEADLYERLTLRLQDEGLYDHWLQRVVPYSRVLVRMEGVGLPIDVPRTKREQKKLGREVVEREGGLHAAFDLPVEFNFASDDQLADFLFRDEFDWDTRVKLSKEDMAIVKTGAWVDALPQELEPTKLGREYVYGTIHLKGLGMRPVVKVPQCAARERRSSTDKWCAHEVPSECKPSVSAKVLKVHHFGNEWVRDYVEYKKRTKILQFLDRWVEVEKGGRLYTHFNQTGTATGRLSSSDPVNLQQVPSRGDLGKTMRSLFRAPYRRVFIHGDYSQLEPRLMAHFSHDPELMGAFERGEDVYESATVGVLGRRYEKGSAERALVKTCFLAMGYGAREKKIQTSLAEDGFYLPYAQVKAAYRGLIDLYSVFYEWKEECIAKAEVDGYVETIGGHRRSISWVNKDMRWKSENQAVNSGIQGSAADIFTEGQVIVARDLPFLDPVLVVHDEALWETYEAKARGGGKQILLDIQTAMEEGHGYKLDVALKFEPHFITAWSEGK